MKPIAADWNHPFTVPESLHDELLDLWVAEEGGAEEWGRALRAAEHFINAHPGARWGRLAVSMDLLQLLDRAGHVVKRLQGERVKGNQTVIE